MSAFRVVAEPAALSFVLGMSVETKERRSAPLSSIHNYGQHLFVRFFNRARIVELGKLIRKWLINCTVDF